MAAVFTNRLPAFKSASRSPVGSDHKLKGTAWYIDKAMQRIICNLLSVFMLLAALGWSIDGHASLDESHEPGNSLIERADQPQKSEFCDHHCHAGSHLVAVPIQALSLAPVGPTLSPDEAFRLSASNGKDSLYRPPIS